MIKKNVFLSVLFLSVLFLQGCLADYKDYASSVQTINTADPARIAAIGVGIEKITSAAVAGVASGVAERPLSVLETAGTSDDDGAEVKVYSPVDRGVEWMARREIARDMANAFIDAIQSRPAGLEAPVDAGVVAQSLIGIAVPFAGIVGATEVFKEGMQGAGTTYSGTASDGGAVGGNGSVTKSTVTETTLSKE